ncbi:ABC transporter substrate-binding protein [Halanaerobium salsuginis]|jgi:multiple sugar transport system substrate-binding protein|uniref:Multiple sugar transport system substrate-binding protein n=1 Tax=Halanaerobium salsuginis TaxID=29563 RepID=A0A1I4HVM8_9FIRM|nr:sugar ABC transporter substrate-binding protein [Halanaerobium salsuginis]SFL45837.1 multiple sugar transport system substrate-binding protein [Halanaerobium salsuginis]
MKKKTIIFLGLILILCVISVSAAEPVTIRVSWWGSQSRHNKTLKVIDLFEKQHPEINIEPQYTGWSGYWEQMSAQAAGGNLPDVMQHDRMYLTQYIDNDRILSLNSYVESGILDISNVDQPMEIVDDQLYGVTLGVNAFAVAYNKEMFDEAGIAEPSPDWTWQDFMATARELKEKLPIKYGSTILPGAHRDVFGFRIWLRQHGKSLYNEAADGLGYDDDQLFTDFFSMYEDLKDEGIAAPAAVTEEAGHNIEMDPFVKGEAAMSSMWSNQVVAASSAAGKKVDLALMPNAEDQVQSGMFIKPGMYFTVSKNSDHPEAAAKFINFFINNLEANKIIAAGRGVPVSAKIREEMAATLDEVNKEQFEYINLATEHSSAIYAPPPENHPQIRDLLTETVLRILYGQMSAEQAAGYFRDQAVKILN